MFIYTTQNIKNSKYLSHHSGSHTGADGTTDFWFTKFDALCSKAFATFGNFSLKNCTEKKL